MFLLNFQIQKEPITCAMKEKVMKDLIQQTIQEKVQPELEDIKEDISKRSWQFKVILAVVFALISYSVFRGPDEVLPEEVYDKDSIVRMLMLEYRHTRCTLKLLPGFPESDAHMEHMFVDLDLVYKVLDGHHSAEVNLESEKDIFILMDKHGEYYKRTIISGEHGSGKSTLMSKFACDWSTNETDLYISSEKIVFILDFVKMQPGETLVDTIRNQLLPKVSSKNLMNIIRNYSEQCVFLFDGVNEGFDILSKQNPTDIKDMLSNKWLQDSLVIVTSTPNKLSKFFQHFGSYTRIKMKGFSFYGTYEFIRKFFKESESSLFWEVDDVKKGVKPFESMSRAGRLRHLLLASHGRASVSLLNLSKVPMMLTFLCLVWMEKEQLPQSLAALYLDITLSLAKHQVGKEIDEKILEDRIQCVLSILGQHAWISFLEDIPMSWHKIDAEVLTEATELGLVLKHKNTLGVKVYDKFYFLHDSFKEMSIAMCFVDLAQKIDSSDFIENMDELTHDFTEYDKHGREISIISTFACGFSPELAERALKHIIVQISKSKFLFTHESSNTYAMNQVPEVLPGNTQGVHAKKEVSDFSSWATWCQSRAKISARIREQIDKVLIV